MPGKKLSGLGFLPPGTADELKGSYIFLRNVEHYIQLDQNRQTQRLPQSEDGRMRLVFAMGFEKNEAAFLKALEMHCSIVHSKFQELFHEKPEDEGEQGGSKRPAGPEKSGLFAGEPFERLQETLRAYPASVQYEINHCALEKFAGIGDRALLEKILVRTGYLLWEGRAKGRAEKAV